MVCVAATQPTATAKRRFSATVRSGCRYARWICSSVTQADFKVSIEEVCSKVACTHWLGKKAKEEEPLPKDLVALG